MKKSVRGQEELANAARDLVAEADRLLSSTEAPRQRFRDALERLRAVLPPPPPAPPSKRRPVHTLTQEEWDVRTAQWALALPKGARVTIESALKALLPPEAAGGEPERNAIGRSLTRLPGDEFTSSWYPSGTSLAPVWIRL